MYIGLFKGDIEAISESYQVEIKTGEMLPRLVNLSEMGGRE